MSINPFQIFSFSVFFSMTFNFLHGYQESSNGLHCEQKHQCPLKIKELCQLNKSYNLKIFYLILVKAFNSTDSVLARARGF